MASCLSTFTSTTNITTITAATTTAATTTTTTAAATTALQAVPYIRKCAYSDANVLASDQCGGSFASCEKRGVPACVLSRGTWT